MTHFSTCLIWLRRGNSRWLLSAFCGYFALAAMLATGGCDRKIAGGRADGAAIFKSACAGCHGPAGVPSETMRVRLGVRNLTEDALHLRLSDADLERQVLQGSPNKKMPSFKGALSKEQLGALVTHLRTLRRPPPPN